MASLAEANRIPFDIPEAESELVAGVTTEYTGMQFGLFYLSEYLHTLIVSAVAAALFFGGWDGPFAPGLFWMVLKTLVLFGAIFWIRWTLLRFRSDQLMALCWKYLVPGGLVLVMAAALWVNFVTPAQTPSGVAPPASASAMRPRPPPTWRCRDGLFPRQPALARHEHAQRVPPPTTVQFPKEKRERAERYRTSFALLHDSEGDELCVGCLQCERICPSQVITVIAEKKESPVTGKRRGYAKDFVLDLNACIFCELCVQVCPTDAIVMTRLPETPGYSREALCLTMDPPVRERDGESRYLGHGVSPDGHAGSEARPTRRQVGQEGSPRGSQGGSRRQGKR